MSKNISSCTVSYTALPMNTDLHFPSTLSQLQNFQQTLITLPFLFQKTLRNPGGGGGVKSRMCPPYPKRVVKGDKKGRFLGITVQKGWPRVSASTGTLKNPIN